MLKHWGLSESIYGPIQHYIYPDSVPDEYQETAYLLHAAYYMQFAWIHNGKVHAIELPSASSDQAFEYLQIQAMALMQCVPTVDEGFDDLCKQLNIF